MGAPWEKYAAKSPQAGPWAKYSASNADTKKTYRMENALPGPDGKLYNPDGTEFTAKSAPAPTSDRWADKLADVGNNLGISPITDPLIGGAEAALSGGTNLFGKVTGGLAGAGQMMLNPLSDPNEGAANTSRGIEDYLTYKPGRSGQDLLSPVAKGGETVMRNLPQDPLSQTAVPAFADLVSSLAPIKLGATKGVRALERITPAAKSEKIPVPNTEQLTAAARAAYAAGKESGVIVPASGYSDALTSVKKMATEEGIDPTLHPKSTAVMKRLEAASGKDLSLQQAETLRKIALDAEDDVNSIGKPTADARLAGKIVDELDGKIDALSTNDKARELWGRSRRSQLIDTMVSRAEIKAGAHYTQAGMEHALRQEFKTLALNQRRMRGFTAEQKAAVEKVAKGGPMENTLRTLGKFDPTSGVLPAIASIGTGGILPLAGFLGRRAATHATVKNVTAAREALVGRGLPQALQRQTVPVSSAPPISSIDFKPTPGVMPAKAAAMSRGLDFPPSQVANPTVLPEAPSRGLTASSPPQMQGGLPFKNYLQMNDGGLSVAPPAPKYPGGLDFKSTPLAELYAHKLAGDMKLAEPGAATARQTGRAPNTIFSELRRLEGEVQSLPQSEPFGSPKRKSLEKKLERLRAELLLSVSKGVSQQ